MCEPGAQMANLGRCILVLIGTTVSVGEICSALKYSPPLLPPIQSGIEIYYIDSLVLQHLSCSFSCVNGKGDVGRAFRQDGCSVFALGFHFIQELSPTHPLACFPPTVG